MGGSNEAEIYKRLYVFRTHLAVSNAVHEDAVVMLRLTWCTSQRGVHWVREALTLGW